MNTVSKSVLSLIRIFALLSIIASVALAQQTFSVSPVRPTPGNNFLVRKGRMEIRVTSGSPVTDTYGGTCGGVASTSLEGVEVYVSGVAMKIYEVREDYILAEVPDTTGSFVATIDDKWGNQYNINVSAPLDGLRAIADINALSNPVYINSVDYYYLDASGRATCTFNCGGKTYVEYFNSPPFSLGAIPTTATDFRWNFFTDYRRVILKTILEGDFPSNPGNVRVWSYKTDGSGTSDRAALFSYNPRPDCGYTEVYVSLYNLYDENGDPLQEAQGSTKDLFFTFEQKDSGSVWQAIPGQPYILKLYYSGQTPVE